MFRKLLGWLKLKNFQMKALLLPILFSYISNQCLCQKAIIKEIHDKNTITNEKYIFPLVIIPGNKISSEKINTTLRAEALQIPYGTSEKSIFENVWKTNDGDNHWVLHDFLYHILSNGGNFISMSISFEGGKRDANSTLYFMFDTKSGNKIKIEDLFIEEGKKKLEDSLSAAKIATIKAEISNLRDSLQKRLAGNSDEIGRYKEVIQLYQRCLENDLLTSTEYLKFYVKKHKLYVIVEQCSPGMDRALDDLGRFLFPFKLNNLQPYLSIYAKRLFSFDKQYHR